MNKSENKANEDKIFRKRWAFAKVANRINFLATTERPFYVKRAVARLAIEWLEELRKETSPPDEVTTK
jgi:hypothetical protein